MRPLFTPADTWAGGLYELVIELPAQDDATTRQALATLWRMPQLAGCYARNDVEPTQQEPLSLVDVPVEGTLYGVATLTNGQRCACGSYNIHFEDEGRWLGLYLPMGALGTAYPMGAYPFGRATPQLERMLKTVNEWFRIVAEGIYLHCPFTFGVIGFETDFDGVRAQALEAIPEVRWDGLLIPADGHLLWYPPTEYGPQFGFP